MIISGCHGASSSTDKELRGEDFMDLHLCVQHVCTLYKDTKGSFLAKPI